MNEAARPPFDPARIRAVAFDGYGTLFRIHDAEFRVAVASALEQQGLSHDDHEELVRTWYQAFGRAGPWGQLFGEDGESVDRERMVSGPLPQYVTQWEWWRRQWLHTFQSLGIEGDASAAADHLRDLLAQAEPYDDAAEAVNGLASAGLTVGLFSNADDDFLQPAITRSGLRFSVIQTSQSLRAYKPHPVAFEALADRLGRAPEEILYVGDSAYADVHGAVRAGLRSAWVRRSERPYPEDMPAPDVEVTALAQLLDVFGDR